MPTFVSLCSGRARRHVPRPIASVKSDASRRRSSVWPRVSLVVAIALAWGVSAPPARAETYGAMKGRVVISDTEFTGGWASDGALMKAVKKQGKSVVKGEGGAWTLNLMVFLKEAAGASSVNIVYYDVTRKRDQVNFSEVQVQPSQKIVQLNGVAISKDLGFVSGHKYEVLATRIIGGKEKVYAKGAVTLK